MKLRLKNIRSRATSRVSFNASDVDIHFPEKYLSPTLTALEDLNSQYLLTPKYNEIHEIFAFDESTQNFRALEGDLFFYSSAVIKLDKKYLFNLEVLPYFFSSMRKFENGSDDSIIYSKEMGEARNLVMVKSKIKQITETVEPNSIVLIDGPLIGGNASAYYRQMDQDLRGKNCIPLYFVKNSNSRLIIDHNDALQREYNNDFHWAAKFLKNNQRCAFIRYTDQVNPKNTKVFSYLKILQGFPERVEMHSKTFEKYFDVLPDIFNLISYFFIAQGDYSNPQVRPIAIAEKYAREGLRILNIPVLLGRMGFQPTINQVRFR